MKYKIGDKVKIVRNIHGHHFSIGEIGKVFDEDISASILKYWVRGKGGTWWMSEDEIELIEPQTLTNHSQSLASDLNAEPDMVNHPPHYKAYPLENLEVIKGSMNFDEYSGFLKGNALKYLYRYRTKGKPIEDLEKAIFYINELKGEVRDERD